MLQKVKNKKLYEQVVDQITAQILNGNFKKGSMLPSETELIKMTGVSRITVREALKVLLDVGIITTKKGKGSFVLVDTDELIGSETDRNKRLEYKNIFLESSRARALIEPAAAAYFARTATREQIENLEHASNSAKTSKYDEYMDQFHMIIMQAFNNKLLMNFFESLIKLEQGRPNINLVTPEHQINIAADLMQQHQKILEAIKEHNPEFAFFYMKEHCMYLISVYEKYFDKFYLMPAEH